METNGMKTWWSHHVLQDFIMRIKLVNPDIEAALKACGDYSVT